MLIVGYGVVIPNTWQRCAAVVALIALIGFLPDAYVLSVYGALGPEAIHYLAMKTLWFSVAGAIVVFGAYRIQTLHREVAEARKLGQNVLKERLGVGGMGEVHLAEHVLLRRPCAIKLIRPERTGDTTDSLRFEREVRTTATLTHPNTIQIFDYGHADDGTFYYVMEYLPGLTLSELVKGFGPLPASRAIHFLRRSAAHCARRTAWVLSTATSNRIMSWSASAAAWPTSPNCSTSAWSWSLSASKTARG